MIRIAKQWKTLSRDAKQVWRLWAQNNPVTFDSGETRRVSAAKAFSLVLQRRAIAGEPANITSPPEATTWLVGALSTRDAGPFTENAGYIGFRVDLETLPTSKWFVWASAPLASSHPNPAATFRFMDCLSLSGLVLDDIIPGFGTRYEAVHGSFDGPLEQGEWDTPHSVWFRLHQYHDGQLGPGVGLRGSIEVEL